MIEFKKLQPTHINELLNLGVNQNEFRCIEIVDFWSEQELMEWMERQNDVCIGVFDGNQLVGYCLSHSNFAINKVMIENIYISDGYRKKGLGKSLLNFTIDYYKENYPLKHKSLRFVALAQETNKISINLATSCGFSIGAGMRWIQK